MSIKVYRDKGITVFGYKGIKRFVNHYTLIPIYLLFFTMASNAQSMRSLINDGVDHYKDKKFADSEVNFKKGLEKSPESFEANFNLGDAYYKQQRYDEALNSFQTALSQAQSKEQKAMVHHNIGNSLLKSEKIKESIEAYKKALKLNPDDNDTKYNLSYALNKLNQQKNQQQNKNDQNKDNKDNKNQQNQDQNQNQDKNKQDKDKQNKDKQNQQQDQQNPKNEESKQDNLKQKEQKMSKEEAERILQALKNNEKDLQKKIRKQKGIPVKTDKDW